MDDYVVDILAEMEPPHHVLKQHILDEPIPVGKFTHISPLKYSEVPSSTRRIS